MNANELLLRVAAVDIGQYFFELERYRALGIVLLQRGGNGRFLAGDIAALEELIFFFVLSQLNGDLVASLTEFLWIGNVTLNLYGI